MSPTPITHKPVTTPKPTTTATPQAPASKPKGPAPREVKDGFEPAPAAGRAPRGTAAGVTGTTGGRPATGPATDPKTPPTFSDVETALKDHKTDDATRDMIASYFAPLDMAQSHEAMQKIRDEGLLDEFVDATVRDVNGKPAADSVKQGVTKILETGKLDVYAETFANTPITVGNYGDGKLQFNPGPPRGIELDEKTLAGFGEQDVANILAHETFHAFSDAHGGDGYSALDEGFGIAAREYAFGTGSYDMAEMVYGTKNFYRDIRKEPDYQFGDFSKADPKLTELLNAFSSEDSSQLNWKDPKMLQAEYTKFWEPLKRDVSWDDWKKAAAQATQDMLAARANGTSPTPALDTTATPVTAPTAPTTTAPPGANPLQQLWDWLSQMLGG